MLKMKNINLNSFSCEEIKERVLELEQELTYEKETNSLFYKENQVLKQEFYKLEERILTVEKFKKQIELFLNNKETTCLEKLNSISQTIGVLS
jgi:FtsZ-binding cell division protein ZapB